MSIYLELAEEILREAKQPMSAMQMIRVIYARELAPWHLHGRTQHKTLQARLSEDILRLRERSRFFRTEPGKFFLREFLDDESVPEKHRQPIVARRRQRDLPAQRSLALAVKSLKAIISKKHKVNSSAVLSEMQKGHYRYLASSRSATTEDIAIWTAALVVRASFILTYRVGRYREDRDAFVEKRSIGFFTPVVEDDATLFDGNSFGIISSGIRALSMDLDLGDEQKLKALRQRVRLEGFVIPDTSESEQVILGMVCFDCPDDFEISSSRLAINDLEWLDLRYPLNNVEDFDPWSQSMICEARRIAEVVG